MNRLPTSDQEIKSLLFLCFCAGFGALARILHSKEDITIRRTMGRIMMSMGISLIVFSGAIAVFGQESQVFSGYFSVALGTGSGIFLDDMTLRAKKYLFPDGDGGDIKPKGDDR